MHCNVLLPLQITLSDAVTPTAVSASSNIHTYVWAVVAIVIVGIVTVSIVTAVVCFIKLRKVSKRYTQMQMHGRYF